MSYADPKRLWRDVKEIANPGLRLETVRRLIERIKNELDELTSEEARLSAAYENLGSHPGHTSPELFKLRGLRTLALFLVALDVPVQVLLNSAALPDVPGWRVAAGSVGLALGIAGAVHLVLVHLVHDTDRPARTIRLCKSLAGAAFVATALGATVFLFARQASPEMAGHLVTLTAVSLWTVAEALPLSAGFFSAWAHVLAEPVRAERTLRGVKIRIRGHERFLERLEGEERRLVAEAVGVRGDGAVPPELDQLSLFSERSATRKSNARKGVTALVAVLIALGAGAGPLGAQHAGTAPGDERLCAIFVDRTRSLDPGHREKALKVFFEGLPVFLDEAGCTEVLAGTFADEGAWAPRRWFRVPERPDTSGCEFAGSAAPSGAVGLLANLRGFRDHFRRKAEEACRAERAARGRVHERERKVLLREVREILEAPQLERDTHTHIVAVVENFVVARANPILLLTDGIETPHAGRLEVHLKGSSRVVLVLVPAREKYGGREATGSAAEKWRGVGAEAVPYLALVGPGSWEGIGKNRSPLR